MKMTREEKDRIVAEAVRLYHEGKEDEAIEAMAAYPVPPHIANAVSEVFGKDFLYGLGLNTSEL